MKKILLIGCLTLAAACQPAAPTSAPFSTPFATVQPPTVTATAAPTFTPTPAHTPTPIPLFFTENFDSDPAAWSSFQTSGESTPVVNTQDGSLSIDFSSPNTWYYAIHNAHDYTNVHVDAAFDSGGNEPLAMGLICMYSENKGWLEYNFSTDGTYNILRGEWLATGIARYTPIANDASEYLVPGRTEYEIGITCETKTLWLYINGKLFKKINIERYQMMEGKVGIAAAVFENAPATATFDWFKVSEPGE